MRRFALLAALLLFAALPALAQVPQSGWGWGMATLPDGTRYEGEWRYFVMNGRGVLTAPNGDRYDGEWRDGLMNGRGVVAYANGCLLSTSDADDNREV